jgi:hypothetical protein
MGAQSQLRCLHLVGAWMKRAGFTIGRPVTVQVSDGRLVIEFAERDQVPQAEAFAVNFYFLTCWVTPGTYGITCSPGEPSYAAVVPPRLRKFLTKSYRLSVEFVDGLKGIVDHALITSPQPGDRFGTIERLFGAKPVVSGIW